MPQYKIQTATSVYLGRSTRDLADLMKSVDPCELAKLTNEELLELYHAGEWWGSPTNRHGPQEVLRRVRENLLPYYVLREDEDGLYSILHSHGWCHIPSNPVQLAGGCISLASRFLHTGGFDVRRLPPEGPWGRTSELMEDARLRRVPVLEESLRTVRCDKPIKVAVFSALNWWVAAASNDGLFVSSDLDYLPFTNSGERWIDAKVVLDLTHCTALATEMFVIEDYLDVGPGRKTGLFRLGELVPASEPRRIVDGRVLVASMTGCGEAARVLRPPP